MVGRQATHRPVGPEPSPDSAVLCGPRGHNGKVRSISWSPDDTRLASTGVDGAVYEWRISSMRRERENVLKVISASHCVC